MFYTRYLKTTCNAMITPFTIFVYKIMLLNAICPNIICAVLYETLIQWRIKEEGTLSEQLVLLFILTIAWALIKDSINSNAELYIVCDPLKA